MPHLRSALFVDFDNIFIGLEHAGSIAAEAFARDPLAWIRWLERLAVDHADPESDPPRRILVRRCYLNPHHFNRYRPFFIRSGFEVVDTPPLTAQGKTSSDVFMVLDMIDALHHATRFDEFIIFSGDADFTPLLLRLRKHDRRSLVLTAGYASAAYKAASDHLIEEETFIEQGLGLDEAVRRPPAAASFGDGRRAEVVGRIAERVREMVGMMGAVGAADLPQVYKEFAEFSQGENWLDFYSLRAMTEAVVAAAGDLAIVGEDAWRVEPRPERVGGGAETESAAEPTSESKLDEIREFVVESVRGSAQPVVLGTMAHEVVRRFGDGVKSFDWQHAGSFKAFLERLDLGGVEIASRIPGYLYAPEVHGDFDPGDLHDPFAESHPEIAELARGVSNVTDTPYLSPEQYAVVFSEIAKEVNENGFQLTQTSKAVRDRCNGKGISVARSHISFLLKGLSFSGYRFSDDGGESAWEIAESVLGNTLELCRRVQMDLSDDDERLIEEWILGGMEDEEGADEGQPSEEAAEDEVEEAVESAELR